MNRRPAVLALAFAAVAAGALFAIFLAERDPAPPATPGFRKPIDDRDPPLLVSPRPADLTTDAPPREEVSLPLVRGRDYRGVVRTAAGEPAARVRVVLAVLAREEEEGGAAVVRWFDGSFMRVVERTETGADGRFSIPAAGFAPGRETVFLVADAPERFVPERVADPPRGVDVIVTLRSGGLVSGIVRADETGDPVPDVTVRVRSRVLGAAGFEEDEDVVRTDAEGRYRVDHFVGEPTEFATRYALDAEWRAFPVEMPVVELGETLTKDLAISIAPYVAGTVIDAATGFPVSNALVELSGPYGREFTTGTDGRFVLPRVEPGPSDVAPDWYVRGGPRRLTVSATGYLDASLRLSDAASGERTALEIRLMKGVRVAGVVRDAAGRPSPASVEIAFKGRILARSRAGEGGTFAFAGVPPVRGASLRARESEEKGAGATLLDLDLVADRTLDVVLSDPGTASVVIERRARAIFVDGAGVELPDFGVWPPVRLHGIRHAETSIAKRNPESPQDPSRASGLLAGDYWVDVGWESGEKASSRAWIPVSVGAGETVSVREPDPEESRDALAGLVGWISGRAVDPLGNPVEDVRVNLRAGGGRSLGADECPWLAVTSGAFEFEVPAGVPLEIVVATGEREVVIERKALAPGGHAALGEVTLPAGE